MWAQVCYSSPDLTVSGLGAALARAQIKNNLNCIALLFRDESRLNTYFGLRKTEIASTSVSQAPKAVFQDLFVSFCEAVRRAGNRPEVRPTLTEELIRQRQEHASWIQLFRWSVRDRKKFLELVSILTTLINGLWDVVNSVGLQSSERQQAEATINSLSHADHMAVAASATIASDPLADAAVVQRLSRLSVADQSVPQQPEINVDPQRQDLAIISVLFVDYGNSCEPIPCFPNTMLSN
jgi:hypothetical protein